MVFSTINPQTAELGYKPSLSSVALVTTNLTSYRTT